MILCALILGISFGVRVEHDRVDRIEVNHVFDPVTGGVAFDQVIFWDDNRETAKPDVVAWRMLKNVRRCDCAAEAKWRYVAPFIGGHATPKREGNGYVSEWNDGSRFRRVTAPTFVETWTTHDRELVERDVLPESRRRGL